MKKIFSLMLVVGLSFGMASCSNKKVKKDADVKTENVSSTEDELEIDDSDFIVDADETTELEDTTAVANAEPMTETQPVSLTGTDVYEVQKGETLMWIAFKLYGDYRKWKDIQAANPEVVANGIKEGDKLSYTPSQFAWNPSGLPHLIKRGETLGTISNEKYGTDKKWKKIWDNNRDMIRDPNLIFAGFTLYYNPEERDLASDQM